MTTAERDRSAWLDRMTTWPNGKALLMKPQSWQRKLLDGIAGASPPLTIMVRRWLPSDDDIFGSLFGPQALAARMFGRIDPHWYLGGGE